MHCPRLVDEMILKRSVYYALAVQIQLKSLPLSLSPCKGVRTDLK